jgi:hypothetical protein
LDDAIAMYRKAVALNSSDAQGYMKFASLLFRQHKDKDGQIAVNHALDVTPQNAKSLVELGEYVESIDDPGGAASLFREATRMDPSS